MVAEGVGDNVHQDNECGLAEDEAAEKNLSRQDVVTKYSSAAEITNAALQLVIKECVHGNDVATICRKGDSFIEEKVAVIYNKKVEGEKIKKGVAFPTAISVNEICGHFSPSKADTRELKKGDVCKVALGCHIDGFVTVGAHTFVISGEDGTFDDTGATVVTGRKADVLMAAWTAAEAALRTVKVGNSNMDVTEVMNTAIEQFNCSAVRGVLSHELKQHVIDGSQVIISKENSEEKVDHFEFKVNEVYAMDVYASTGEGKPKEVDIRTTIYKRDVDQSYKLKTQLGRKFVHEVNTRFPTLPFTTCAFDDERMAKAGIFECVRHGLITPFPVLSEKAGEYVAQFQFTVLLLPGGTKKVTGLPFSQMNVVKSDHAVTDQNLIKLLQTSLYPKKKKKPLAEVKKSVDTPAA